MSDALRRTVACQLFGNDPNTSPHDFPLRSVGLASEHFSDDFE